MKTLPLFALLSLATAATAAHAAEPAAAGSDCIILQQDQQIVRAGANRDILLRNGDQHYVVRFNGSCSSAAISPKLEFITHGKQGQLCGAGATRLRTNVASCTIAAVEPIDAEQFALKAKQRR